MKFRAKPNTHLIEAYEVPPGIPVSLPEGMEATPGDWLIVDEEGNQTLLHDADFSAQYEPAGEDPHPLALALNSLYALTQVEISLLQRYLQQQVDDCERSSAIYGGLPPWRIPSPTPQQ